MTYVLICTHALPTDCTDLQPLTPAGSLDDIRGRENQSLRGTWHTSLCATLQAAFGRTNRPS